MLLANASERAGAQPQAQAAPRMLRSFSRASGTSLAAFLTQIETLAWTGELLEYSAMPRPTLVPDAYRAELDRLRRGELADVAWHLAQLIHDLADDAEGDMIELRCAIEFVQDRHRPSAVILHRRS
jgi:hypothetical protein